MPNTFYSAASVCFPYSQWVGGLLMLLTVCIVPVLCNANEAKVTNVLSYSLL